MRYKWIQYRYMEMVSGNRPRFLMESEAMMTRTLVGRPYWRPAVDFIETTDNLQIKVELAGIHEDEIEITLYPDALIVEGSRKGHAPGDACYHAAEIRYGPFRLEIPLPVSVDRERVSARLEQGMLILNIPKA